jgi:formylglycine-generating enzyme required for sulfatase activity
MPVVDISYYDTLRFANWMQNGQPNTGSQTSATTEDGTYTFSGIQSVGPRHAGAAIALASENEWYKAAYFDPTSASYFDYPTGTNAQSTCATPTAAPNSANCGSALADPSHPVGDLTPVGSYPGSPSPYGTFDQGGNVGERNETVPGGYRGNHFQGAPGELAASVRYADGVAVAEPAALGFRLVLIPEPGTGLLVSMGLVMLSRRRQRA